MTFPLLNKAEVHMHPSSAQFRTALNNRQRKEEIERWLNQLISQVRAFFHLKPANPTLAETLLYTALQPAYDLISNKPKATSALHQLEQFKRALIYQHCIDPRGFDEDLVQHDDDTDSIYIVHWLANALMLSDMRNAAGDYPEYVLYLGTKKTANTTLVLPTQPS